MEERIETLSATGELPTVRDTVQRLGPPRGQPAQTQQVLAGFERQLDAQQRWLAQTQHAQPAPGVLLVVGQGGSDPLLAWGDASAGIRRQVGGNLATYRGPKALSAEGAAGTGSAAAGAGGFSARAGCRRSRPCCNTIQPWPAPRPVAKGSNSVAIPVGW